MRSESVSRLYLQVDPDEFPQQFAELLAYVDGFPDDHPFKPLTAIPDDVPLPPLWILGSSLYGGQAAAAFGTLSRSRDTSGRPIPVRRSASTGSGSSRPPGSPSPG